MSKTYTSRSSSVGTRGSITGTGNQRGRGRGVTPVNPNARPRGTGISSSGRGSVAQATRGGMYSSTSGAGTRGGRGITPSRTRPDQMNPPNPATDGAVGGTSTERQSGDVNQRMSYQGGYTLVSPNEKKRQQIAEQAQRETESYEQYKKENKVQHVSYVGTVGGGQMTQQEVRRQQIQSQAKSKYNMLEKRQMLQAEQKKQENDVYDKKKLEARRKTEENAQRASRDNDKKKDEMERIKKQFLDRLEKEGAKGVDTTASPVKTTDRKPGSLSHDLPPRPQLEERAQGPSHVSTARPQPEERVQGPSHMPSTASASACLLTSEQESDLMTLQAMFPQYSKEQISQIYSESHSLEVTAEMLSDI